ncbi:MAG: methionine--tRNA ligase [Candidatus Kaiserbacteria bacterium]|nr:methionine--tRNA ligase [Candidatus Kaiserbacteria bacterium]
MKPLYLTTTLPYVNADPHIGFALECVQADIQARYRSLMGSDVFFNTGTDEHGLKILQKAREEGKEPQAYTDEYAEKFRALKERLGLSEGLHFIRTTDAHHKSAAQEIWRRCFEKGDIYKKKYKGLYCVGDEMFLKESDLVNGRCPNHPTMDPIEIEEENYFFRLSAYQDKLTAYLSQVGVIVPEWRRQEALKFVQSGLEDFSISRDKSRLSWGIPVPGDDSQVMYVWFDALTNYISTLGWPEDSGGNFKKFWENGETLQMAGKDQVRFQSIMWQAMLLSAGVKNTDRVVYHGFITSGGQKMSKSVGNVIDPYAIVAEYGTDALRYFLARHIHPFEDSDFTMERFKEAYNADLANGIGNLTARIMTLAETHLEKPIVRPEANGFPKEYTDAVESYDTNKSLDFVWTEIQKLDQKIAETKPFTVVKEDAAAGKKLIAELATELYVIVRMLNPFMPETNKAIKETILANKKPATLFPRKE